MDDILIPTDKEKQDAIASLPAVREISENNVVLEIHGIKVPGRVLTAVIQGLAEGKILTFSDPQVEVSTQEAADILKVSRPFVLRLFDKGLIPGRLVGKHRRMLRTDVEEYKTKKAKQLASMIEYQRLSDDLEPGMDEEIEMEKTTGQLVALLDANVLYGNKIRDVLLWLAYMDVYIPRWTERIQKEWSDNLAKNRLDLTREKINKTMEHMSRSFPEACVNDYEEVEQSLTLPDPNDRHVLAAAIRSGSRVIVTENIKDFPAAYTSVYNINVMTVDQFITMLIREDRAGVMYALEEQRKSFKKPPQTLQQMFDHLESLGLSEFVNLLRVE